MAAYAPVSTWKARPEREKFWNELAACVERVSSDDMLIVGGDFNAEVGAEKDRENTDVLGYGDTNRTQTGTDMIERCRENGLMVASTFFKFRP